MRYAMLLSGGVDSSTSLAELVSAGHDVTAYYLKVWLEDELDYLGACPWEEDLSFARQVCDRFGVELRVVPLQLEYYDRVVSYTIAELKAGRTPSPDIFCNQRIKFGAFYDYITRDASNAPAGIATGHYARILDRGDHVELARSPDPVKDQTYFLSHLDQAQLSRIAFPIGELGKDEVRSRAARYDLPNKDRPDSQGICFLGKIRYPEFVRHYLGERPGRIVEVETDDVLGEHRGFWFYTIGQRTGLGLAGGPWYVVRKDTTTNTIYVSHSRNANERARRVFVVSELSWTWRAPDISDVLLKIRHGSQLTRAKIRWLGDDTIRVEMERPDRGVAPGQFAVFYDGEVCLGSGKIKEAECESS
ncbi:MAG: tRNA 2-thiouridine(34) synthase MnmA [Spirochaetota bacterium]